MLCYLFATCVKCKTFKREEAVSKVYVVDVRSYHGKEMRTTIYYQELDKNDSLIYSEYYGLDNRGDNRPISILEKYFVGGRLSRKIFKYAGQETIENIFYTDSTKISVKNNGDSVLSFYDFQKRLIKERFIANRVVKYEKVYNYKYGFFKPEIIEYRNGKMYFKLITRCRNDTCLTFLQDSIGHINDTGVSIYQNNKIVGEFFNSRPLNNLIQSFNFKLENFSNYTYYKYDLTGHFEEIDNYVNGRLASKQLFQKI